MEKMSVAKKNELLRKKAYDLIIKEEVKEDLLLQVAGSKFMLNVDFEGEKIPVRIDFVVPKIDAEDTLQFAEDFADAFKQEQEAGLVLRLVIQIKNKKKKELQRKNKQKQKQRKLREIKN